jgi:predicted nucleic acid-binding protein
VTVLDASGAVDYLLGWAAADAVQELLRSQPWLSAPDILVFEVVSALRRQTQRGALPADRAMGAVADLSDLRLRLYPSMPLRTRAWELRESMTAADALYVALAERLGRPLASKDSALLSNADRCGVPVLSL